MKRTLGLLLRQQQLQAQVLQLQLRQHQKAVHHFAGDLEAFDSHVNKRPHQHQQLILTSKFERFFKQQQIKAGMSFCQ
jgi:hypothetical protein